MKPNYNNGDEPLILLLERNVLTGAAIALVLVMLALLMPQSADTQNTKWATVPLLMLPLLVDLEDSSINWYGNSE